MGYYTDYKIFFYDKKGNHLTKNEYEIMIMNLKNVFDFLDEINENIPYGFDIHTKWYDCIKNLEDFSKHYCPDILIEIYGDGEESDDLWKSYVMNGKSLYADGVTIYPDLDHIPLRNIANDLLGINNKNEWQIEEKNK